MHSNLPAFNRPFLAVEMADFLQKPLSTTRKNEGKQQAIRHFLLLPSNGETLICSCTLYSRENDIPGYVIHTRRKTFHSPTRIAHAKACSSHRCEVNILRKVACNFSTGFKILERNFSENPLQNLNGVTDFSQENF